MRDRISALLMAIFGVTVAPITEELIFHGAGPETEVVRLCSAVGGRRYKFPEGPEGYGHSFFSTDRPAYRPEAATDGWRRVFAFFERHLLG